MNNILINNLWNRFIFNLCLYPIFQVVEGGLSPYLEPTNFSIFEDNACNTRFNVYFLINNLVVILIIVGWIKYYKILFWKINIKTLLLLLLLLLLN